MLTLKNRRLELGLTQEELGKEIGKNKRYISDLENGHSLPSVYMLKKLCSVLDVSSDWLLEIKRGA